MLQFDVYRRAQSADLLLDCQSDLLSSLPTRFLVPLLASDDETVSPRLNPRLVVNGRPYILAPQLALTAPVDRIGTRVGSLADERYVILTALDFLLTGV